MKRCSIVILLLNIAGCALVSSPQPARDLDPEGYRQRSILTRWQLEGRLLFSSSDNTGIVKLHWSQDRARYLLRFIAPLGRGTYVLRGDGDEAYLLTADNAILRTTDLGSLLQKSLGAPIPVDALQYWVRGVSAPDARITRRQLDSDGKIIHLAQGGWQIDIKRYREVDGIALPDKIFMRNEAFELKLVIQSWNLRP